MDKKHIKYTTNYTGNSEESFTINNLEPKIEDLQNILCKLIKEDLDKENLKDMLIDYVVTIGSIKEKQYSGDTYKFIYSLDINEYTN